MAHRIAIVGVGKIARDQHIPAIEASDAFELAATVSRNATVDGVPGFRTIDQLIPDGPGVAAVALCAPPQVRYAQARAALEAGLHVMLEKPPGATLSEVEALNDLASERDLTLFATWHSRYAPAVPDAKAWLEGRTLRSVAITWREDVRHWHPGQDWIWEAGGLGVFDPGINALSILTEILPHAVHLTKAILEFPENCATPIAARLAFTDHLDTPVQADLDWRQTGPQTWDIVVETTDGVMRLADGGASLQVDGEMAAQAPEAEYPGLYARFAELLETGASDVDVAPLRHVADAFMLGRREVTAAFSWDD